MLYFTDNYYLLPLDKATRGVFNTSTGNCTMLILHSITVQYGQSIVNVSIVAQGSDFIISHAKEIPPTKEKHLECEYVQDRWIKKGGVNWKGKNHVAITFLAFHQLYMLVSISKVHFLSELLQLLILVT